jgi:hypothetical protein
MDPPHPGERLLICSDGRRGGVLNRKIGPKSRFGATVFLGVKPVFANHKYIFERVSLQPSRSPTQHVAASRRHPHIAEALTDSRATVDAEGRWIYHSAATPMRQADSKLEGRLRI